MNKSKLIVAMFAATAIASRRIVTFKDKDDSQVELANAKTDTIWGVSSDLDAAIGDPIDIVCSGSASVEYGDTIKAGQLLTSDAQGHAVPATAGNRTIGIAMQNGVVQDIGSVLISPSAI